jgi:hypothetical protein
VLCHLTLNRAAGQVVLATAKFRLIQQGTGPFRNITLVSPLKVIWEASSKAARTSYDALKRRRWRVDCLDGYGNAARRSDELK